MLKFAWIVLLMAPIVVAQEDQLPREPKKDAPGLLQINQQFFDLAAATGGDFYFWAPGEFATGRLQIPLHGNDAVVLAYGKLDAKRTFEIPVETGVERLTVFAGIQRKDLAVIVRPDRTIVHDNDRDVQLQTYAHMLIATVQAPAAGKWQLELDGAGTYAVTAHVKPGTGPFTENERVFVALDGTVIGQGTPDKPYRVMVRGVDANGAQYQRVESPLHKTATRPD